MYTATAHGFGGMTSDDARRIRCCTGRYRACRWWRCHRPENRLNPYLIILRRLTRMSPAIARKSPIVAAVEELPPVSGSETVSAKPGVGATVGVVATLVGVGVLFGSVGVAGTATGVPVIAFDATESPIAFMALMVTE